MQNQREQLLAFAKLLEDKLAEIAERLAVPLFWVREVCVLQRKRVSSTAYWQHWNQLHHELKSQFHWVFEAVTEGMRETPRASSMLENLIFRLRNYFFLRRQLGASYLELLRFSSTIGHLCAANVPREWGKGRRS